jgi:hypothetical protein
MFNLEQSIAEWRKQMLAAGIQSPVPLEELEVHLREDIERQIKSGLSDQEAFNLSTQNFGPTMKIQTEFQKVASIEEASKWKHGQILLAASTGLLQVILIGAVLFNSEMQFTDRLSSLGAMATSFVLAAIAGLLSFRFFPATYSPRQRKVIIFLGGGLPLLWWSSIFAPFILTGHEFPFGEWLSAVLWATCPILGVCFGFIWGIEAAARKKIMTADELPSRN